jgi:hypothetical protein
VSRFEDRLWDELVAQHGALLLEAPPRVHVPVPAARRRAPIVALGLALAAGLAAIVIALGSGGNTPAYAVVRNQDGTVTVTIRELVGVEGASRKLESLGVPVRVAGPQAGCITRRGAFHPDRVSPDLTHRIATFTGPPGVATVIVAPNAIPAGDTLLLAAHRSSARSIAFSASLYRGAAPSCLPPLGS